jgi:aryl-alcohol dehydrogenase-like predicted oxidoreductase
MDYGVSGHRQPTVVAAVSILNCAINNGVDTIDTASAYGDSETIIGEWLSTNKNIRKKVDIISKLAPAILDGANVEEYNLLIKGNLEQSLRRLNTDYLDGYLLHNANHINNEEITDCLIRLKKEGYVRNIGASVYEANDAIKAVNNSNLDIIQLPYSIFDQRMLHSGVFDLDSEKGFMLHSRSTLLQGLILMEENDVPPFLAQAKPYVAKIAYLCEQHNVSRLDLAIAFVKCQAAISHIVFGVENVDQLKAYVKFFENNID